ncbi:hypothetical protein CDIK_4312 [Cucumispora dikerogammari]|nr:hypothetical protein CDIK_4312 [Cucumispora dikerogammari]
MSNFTFLFNMLTTSLYLDNIISAEEQLKSEENELFVKCINFIKDASKQEEHLSAISAVWTKEAKVLDEVSFGTKKFLDYTMFFPETELAFSASVICPFILFPLFKIETFGSIEPLLLIKEKAVKNRMCKLAVEGKEDAFEFESSVDTGIVKSLKLEDQDIFSTNGLDNGSAFYMFF